MKGKLAVFDFDGTITCCDTFRDFLIWKFGYLRFCVHFSATFISVLMYVLGFADNSIPKERLFRRLCRGLSEKEFDTFCVSYAETRLPRLIKAAALKRIKFHLSQGHEVIIVSASLSDWILPWARREGISKVLATRPEISAGILTGNFQSKCPFGPLKLEVLRKAGVSKESHFIYAYGDSVGDREMLAWADVAAYRSFPKDEINANRNSY